MHALQSNLNLGITRQEKNIFYLDFRLQLLGFGLWTILNLLFRDIKSQQPSGWGRRKYKNLPLEEGAARERNFALSDVFTHAVVVVS